MLKTGNEGLLFAGRTMLETFYLHLEFLGKNGWSINLPFVCVKCGNCCRLEDFLCAGEIKAEPHEHLQIQNRVKTLFEELGNMWKSDEGKYDKYIMESTCPFLADNSCSIYEIRPEGCRLFPKTAFGMQTLDCEPLNRFKKMCKVMKKGRRSTGEYYLTGKVQVLNEYNELIKPVKLTQKQYQTCIIKLRQAGITDDELTLFNFFNRQK
jgi:Fe-S-cluster containining protein